MLIICLYGYCLLSLYFNQPLKTKYMDTLIILLVGYVILKSIFSGGDDNEQKAQTPQKKQEIIFWERHSHIFRLRHMESLAWG